MLKARAQLQSQAGLAERGHAERARRFWAMLMLCLCLPLAATVRGDQTRYDVRHFADCKAAAAYSAAHPTLGRYTYRLAAKLLHAHIFAAGHGTFQGRAQAVIFLAGSQLEIPRWSWPGMTAAQRAAYNDFVTHVREHEIGHDMIARNGIAGRPFDLTVLAHTRALADRALRTAFSTQLAQTSASLLQKEQLYDRVTEHGRKQSEGPLYDFPGGDDVEFSCP